ncbi:MAG: VTT domain-containing protein [Candidatus Parvarchaeota archaeon]|nr:VTT domain-containing protein [Candidatus Jingweiarchaeum tengchongense]MCW1298327.1 VTT domain-containing protein [Candidatus Jingweiarchaeum tengchongense]MCW1300418.1 VTT domain-containing protein [Candidatus Jingweiarchaeum tengchongense]MCW1304736.1 VTT domain-containing protein [Candidatus Jingweiarchaeum tengchongense]MCW1310565.1 VTT domain-containing protein [Candidatus Jingweiarchaeum tengchongense]
MVDFTPIFNFLWRHQISGIFFVSFFGSLIFLPCPLDFFIIGAIAMGMDAFQVLIASSVGAILASIVNYFIGLLLEKKFIIKYVSKKDLKKTENFMEKYGPPIIIGVSVTPLSIDIFSVIAGSTRMHFGLFLISIVIGRVLKNILLIYGGSEIRNIFLHRFIS